MALTNILPEELLERILEQALPQSRPQWLRSPIPSVTRLAPLCVSRQFNRIATPLLYHTIRLNTPNTARLLLKTLQDRPEYIQYIRELVVLGVWHPAIDILGLCHGLTGLDLTIAFDDEANERDVDLNVFKELTGIKHLTLRKPSNTYLSLPRPRALIISLANAITTWSHLLTANIAFKLSDDTPTSPITSRHPFSPFTLTAPTQLPTQVSGPITALASALAAAPALHTFSTQLPSVWNTSIALIASNPTLERICLTPASATGCRPSSYPHPVIPGTGLFLMEARRHLRLSELIGAGTPIIRSRAHTLGTAIPASSPSPSPSPPAAAQTKASVGLGLRIDTSEEAINGSRSQASAQVSFMSPVALSASAGPSAINPAWMGPSRSMSVKGKSRMRG